MTHEDPPDAVERFNAELDQIIARRIEEMFKGKVVFAHEDTPIPDGFEQVRVMTSNLVPPGKVYVFNPAAMPYVYDPEGLFPGEPT